MLRLETLSKPLADKLRLATPIKRRKAALVACRLAMAATPSVEPELLALLEKVEAGASLTEEEGALVETFKNRHDEHYFELQDLNDPRHLLEFSAARAAAALQFATSAPTFEASAEAIYEASCAVDAAELLLRGVTAALQS